MLEVVSKVFNPAHVETIRLKEPDKNFPDRIEGIKCKYCDYMRTANAIVIISHLQKEHKLKISEIIQR